MQKIIFKVIAWLILGVSGIAGAALIFLLATEPSCDNYINDSGRLQSLKDYWGNGEVVVLVRHTDKCIAEMKNCPEGELGISEKGIMQAKLIGDGFSQIGLTNAIILSSPVRRTRQTADTAFDGQIEEKAWLRENCRQEMFGNLVDYKVPGKNLIAVTHSECLNSLLGSFERRLLGFNARHNEQYGVAAFFKLTGKAAAPKVLGCIWPTHWRKIL